MRHDYIKLVGYTRMPLATGDTFEKYFDHHVTIIKGGNGVGKSSLYREMSLLPSDKKFFKEGIGYKEIRTSHKGSSYIGISDFTNKTPKYSFVVNDVELNQAGLSTAQKGLVESHFGITQIIHDILVGKELFTRLNLGARKKLFAALTKLNIDKILKSFDGLNTQLNLNKLMLKTENQQLTIEENKLLDEEAKELLKLQLEDIRKQLGLVVDTRSHLARFFNPEINEGSLEDLRSTIDNYYRDIKSNFIYLTTYPAGSIDYWKEVSNSELNELKLDLKSNYRRIEEVQETLKSLGFVTKDEVLVDVQIRQHEELLTKLKEEAIFIDFSLNRDEVERTYFLIYNTCNDYLSELLPNKENGEYQYTGQMLRELIEKIVDKTKERSELKAVVNSIKCEASRLDEIEGNVKCPSCQTSWTLKELYTKDKDRQKELGDLNKKIIDLDNELELMSAIRLKIENYFHHFKMFISLKKETINYHPFFWKEVEEGDLLVVQPHAITYLVTQLTVSMEKYRQYHAVKTELERLYEKKALRDKLGEVDSESLRNEELRLHEVVSNISDEIEEVENKLDDIRYAEKLHKHLDLVERTIERLKDVARGFNLSHVVSSVFNELDKQITSLKLEEVDLTKRLHENDVVESTLTMSRNKITDIEDNIMLLELAINKLSPKNGLIAETISSFLNNIIVNMNLTLDRIWSYPMCLQEIDVDKGSLDYRFKVLVNDTLSVDDISELSDGQQEGVNLSFRVLLYVLMGFHDYPLWFDELARSLDVEHTENMMKLVRDFTNDTSFSQVFIINHKENTGFIQDVDTLELKKG